MSTLLKNLITSIIILQFAISPLARASDDFSFDFGDEGSVITNGPDCDDRSDRGNCAGAGCGDRDGHGRSGDYDDDGPDINGDKDGRHGQGDGRGDGRDHNDYPNESNRRLSIDDPYNSHTIIKQDADRGDGVIFVRDSEWNNYYPGEEEYSDIYTDVKGNHFVKSADKTKLLPLKGLKICASDLECGRYGYKEDWWNYSWPDENIDGDYEYSDHVSFAEKRLTLKHGIEKAEALIPQNSEKQKIVKVVKNLYREAGAAYVRDHDKETTRALQDGALQLLATIVDIGISVSPLGWAKDTYEFITGTSLISGHALSNTERVMAAAGMVLPGVASLAIAGVRIARSVNAGKTAVRDFAKLEKAIEALGHIKIERFKEGRNLTEVAVIGRDMGSVKDASARLNAAGIETRLFVQTEEANLNLAERARDFADLHIPYDRIPATLSYTENMSWVESLKRENMSIIDIGNPKGLKERSRFYDDEVLNLFNEVNRK